MKRVMEKLVTSLLISVSESRERRGRGGEVGLYI